MCSDCKGWDTHVLDHKNFIRGYSDDGFEETRHVKASKKVRPKKKPGCPENNGGAHVYVWTTEGQPEDLFYRYFGYHKYETKRCAGCRKVGHTGRYRSRHRRYTERYVKRFKPVGWEQPERKHAGYAEYRRKWLVQHGLTHEYYSYLY